MTLLWSFERTGAVEYWVARAGPYELCAYEDGRWWVDRAERVLGADRSIMVASGTSQSLKHAKQIAALVYEFTLKPG